MLLALALIPAIGLLITIYCCDRNKEPKWLLIILFFAGAGTTIGAGIAEVLLGNLLEYLMPYDSVAKPLIEAFLIVAPVEEISKFIIVKSVTWRNRHFDYLFDGIVYSVAVSLGFAALENVMYVTSSGFFTGIVRMFSSVPGHMCFAVFMGFFYSKAKYAIASGKKAKSFMYTVLSIVVPSLIHGLYDGLLFVKEVLYNDNADVILMITWVVVLIALFIVTIVMIVKTSRNDYCIIILPDNTQIAYRPALLGKWICSNCSAENDRNFCGSCGSKRPVTEIWYCPVCANRAFSKFCGNCGTPRPSNNEPVSYDVTQNSRGTYWDHQ